MDQTSIASKVALHTQQRSGRLYPSRRGKPSPFPDRRTIDRYVNLIPSSCRFHNFVPTDPVDCNSHSIVTADSVLLPSYEKCRYLTGRYLRFMLLLEDQARYPLLHPRTRNTASNFIRIFADASLLPSFYYMGDVMQRDSSRIENPQQPAPANESSEFDPRIRDVLCLVCKEPCHRSSRHGWRDRLRSWFGWYPWRCRKCRAKHYVRRRS